MLTENPKAIEFYNLLLSRYEEAKTLEKMPKPICVRLSIVMNREGLQKFLKKLFINLLTNPRKYDILYIQRGEHTNSPL